MSQAEQTVAENIRLLQQRLDIHTEQRKLCIDQLVSMLLAAKQAPLPRELYEEFMLLLGEEADRQTLFDFCDALASGYEKRGISLSASPTFSGQDSAAPGSHEKIALVRNHYNDNAFSHFSDLLPHAKASYYADFYECCEAVLHGECEFSILPLENTADGRLFRFYSLLERYDLKIRSACDLESQNAMSTVRYALVAKSMSLPSPLSSATPCFLEIELTYREDQNVADVLDAAMHLGISLYRTDTLTISYEDERIRHYHSFIVEDEASLIRFLLFLHIRYTQFTLLGLYYAV